MADRTLTRRLRDRGAAVLADPINHPNPCYQFPDRVEIKAEIFSTAIDLYS
jgi:hypothetical protein